MVTETGTEGGGVAPPPGCPVPERPSSAPAPGSLLPSHYAHCLGCGQDHPTGLRLQLVAGQDLRVSGSFTLSEHHQGAPGLAHGGILAAALDEVLGGLAWLLQRPMVTGRLQVEYLRPAPVGSTLDLEAEVVGVLGRRIFCRGSAVVADGSGLGRPGDALARAQGVFVAVPLEHFRTHGRPLPVPERSWQVNP